MAARLVAGDVGRHVFEGLKFSGAWSVRMRPGDKATQEGLAVQRGDNVAQMVVARRPIGEATEAAQQPELPLAEARNVNPFRPRMNRQQRQEQDFIQRIGHFAGLPMIR